MNDCNISNTTQPKRIANWRRSAFTLVELMVVMAILAIVIGMTLAVTGRAVNDAKARQTRAILIGLQSAVDQFKLDAPLRRMKKFNDRYRGYPPDELGAFEDGADRIKLKGVDNYLGPIGPGGKSKLVFPGAAADHPLGGIKAMALAIRLYSPKGALALDQIGATFRKPSPPDQYFDRNGNNVLDTEDEPLISFVDAWGTPIAYFATNPVPGSNADNPPTAGAGREFDRFKTAEFMVAKNLGKPVLVSFGPDGAEQCSAEFIQSEGVTDLVADYDPQGPKPHVIDNPLNDDNVYIDEGLRDRLKQPLPSDRR